MQGIRNVREVILDLLLRIERDGGYSHLLIDRAIKEEGLASADQGLMTEIVYGTLQRKMTLDYYLSHYIQTKKKVEPWTRMLLRLSVYQLVFLDRIPDHAIIHEAASIAKKRGHKGIQSFVNGVLRNMQRKGMPDTEEITPYPKRLATETSHPEWLVERWIAMYGKNTVRDMCWANLDRKPLSIRVQPLKMDREKASDVLREEGVETEKSTLSNQGLIIRQGNLLETSWFRNGYGTIQDQSSMLAVDMLPVTSGMTVLDACSAPGGKTTHIAEKMQDNGVVYAYDLHAKKTNLVRQKAQELDLASIQAVTGDARNLGENHDMESFDAILVDAPCSGLGVIRGKPDIKYQKKPADIEKLAQIQAAILEAVAPLLKKGGHLIYSTCTVDEEENEANVRTFLENHPDFRIDADFFSELPTILQDSIGISQWGLQLFPQTGTDGFFLTRLMKEDTHE